MPRRISLALALAFTTVVTFAIVAIGAHAGVFSGSHASNTAVAAREAPTSAPAGAVSAPSGAPASAAPQMVVETDYVDLPDAAAPAGALALKPAATDTAHAIPSASPTATATGTATQTPRAPATAQAVATATAPPQPTGTTAAMPPEIEFVGTVTAISGSEVTFNHGGTLTAVQVPNPGALAVGVTAHVHALLTSSGYVATEVQAGG